MSKLTMSVNDFETLNLYSQKSVGEIVESVVNESANASFINMFEDSVLILDHVENKFFLADYKFDEKDLKLTIENYEEIELVKKTEEFKESVMDFFEQDDASIDDLAEAYKSQYSDGVKYISECVSESLSRKNFDNVLDYTSITDLSNNDELAEAEWFGAYVNRLQTNPISEVKAFDFESPVCVSIMETEDVAVVNSSAKEKAGDLWKNDAFKEGFVEAAKLFVEEATVEEGITSLVTLFEDYSSSLLLDKADFKTLLGKIIISEADIRSSRKVILEGVDALLEENVLSLTESDGDEEAQLSEAMIEAQSLELTTEQIETIAEELRIMSEVCEDEAVTAKLVETADALTESAEFGTDINLVKEAVSMIIL